MCKLYSRMEPTLCHAMTLKSLLISLLSLLTFHCYSCFILMRHISHFSETYPRVQINVLSKSRLNTALNFFGPTGFVPWIPDLKMFFFSSDLAMSPFYGNFFVESIFPFLDKSQIESLVDFEMSHF